jgi:putative ABC transport system permease protein
LKSRLRDFISRFFVLFQRKRLEQRLQEELDFHVEMQVEENLKNGMKPEEARYAALRSFGGIDQTKEKYRDVGYLRFMEDLFKDIRYSLRVVRQHKGWAAVAILSLAFCMGASTALFSVLDRILFRNLPYPDADRLVSIGISREPFPTEFMPERGYAEYWHPSPAPFESITTILSAGRPCDVTEQQPERLICARVEANLLDVLKRSVVLGRNLTAEDDRPGTPPVALVRHGLWVRRFGRDPNVVGRSINLDGESVRIVGVLPPDFEMPIGKADVLLPQQLASLDSKGTATRFLQGIGRLKSGVTLEQAKAAARTPLEGMLQLLSPQMHQQSNIVVRPLLDRQVGDAPHTAWLLLGAVVTLLLIACINVTNLLLARMVSRRHEFTIRSAIGAGKLRLARFALIESLLFALVAGAVGLLIAALLLKAFVVMAPASIPKIDQASLDARVFIVTAALTLVSGIFVWLWPAVALWRDNSMHGLRITTSVKPRARFILVTAQIALTVAMLGYSALFLRTLWNLAGVPLGFEAERVVILSATLNRIKYPKVDQRAAFFDNLIERARQMPGTLSAALSDTPAPLGLAVTLSNIAVDGQPFPDTETSTDIRQRIVTPQYFETFGIPILQGRAFKPSDGFNSEPAAILTEAAAKILFPGQNPIGRRVRTQWIHPWHVVVGVAQDLRNMGLTAEPQPELYMVRRSSQVMVPSGLAIRTTLRLDAAIMLLQQIAADLDAELPIEIQTLNQQVAKLTERPRFIALLLTTFAAVALLLAASGLYGISSYLVAQRTRDIGIRIALGARQSQLLRDLIGEAGRWIVAGMFLGIAFAWIGGRAVRSQLFGVATTDGISWSIALLVLCAALFVGVLRPAVHVMHVNPVDTLRAE